MGRHFQYEAQRSAHPLLKAWRLLHEVLPQNSDGAQRLFHFNSVCVSGAGVSSSKPSATSGSNGGVAWKVLEELHKAEFGFCFF